MSKSAISISYFHFRLCVHLFDSNLPLQTAAAWHSVAAAFLDPWGWAPRAQHPNFLGHPRAPAFPADAILMSLPLLPGTSGPSEERKALSRRQSCTAAWGGGWPLLRARRETEAGPAGDLALHGRSTLQIWVPSATLASPCFAPFLGKRHERGNTRTVFSQVQGEQRRLRTLASSRLTRALHSSSC